MINNEVNTDNINELYAIHKFLIRPKTSAVHNGFYDVEITLKGHIITEKQDF